MRKVATYFLLLAFMFPVSAAKLDDQLETAEQKGLKLAREASERNVGFGDTTVGLSMVLKASDGRQRTRRLTWKILESSANGEGDKSLTIFHEPRDIAGTALLSHTYILQADDQWLYLPSLKRVKRIASSNKSSSFVGSEFAYEDLLSDEVEKFTYRWLRDEPCGDWVCFVIERIPVYENSGYSRQLVWLDQEQYRVYKTEFFNHKDRLEKTLFFEDYRQYLGRYWRSHTLRMESQITGKITLLLFDPYQFRTGLGREDFSPDTLKRIR
jgi:Outer membrane lipoprotein-sorting protein